MGKNARTFQGGTLKKAFRKDRNPLKRLSKG